MRANVLKSGLAVFLTVIAVSSAVAGDDLVLTGTVTSVSPVRKSEGQYDYRINVRLQFRNDGKEPVIIPLQEVNRRLVFIKDYATNSEVEGVLVKREYPIPRRLKEVKSHQTEYFLRSLTWKVPTERNFLVIPAGGYYEFIDLYIVENGFTFREEPDENSPNRPRIVAIPEFAGLKIEYSLVLADHPDGIDRVLDAKRNWKKFGNLLIGDDGKYSVKSAFIPNYASN